MTTLAMRSMRSDMPTTSILCLKAVAPSSFARRPRSSSRKLLVALSTVVALQAVGIVLVIAMLVTPAATASLLVRRLHQVIFVGVALALASAVIGLYVSYHAGVASGAAIVLVATAFFAAALLVAPRRGLFARWRFERTRRAGMERSAAEQALP